jgi:hypothetical protein
MKIEPQTYLYLALAMIFTGHPLFAGICIALHLNDSGPAKRKRKMMTSKRRLR